MNQREYGRNPWRKLVALIAAVPILVTSCAGSRTEATQIVTHTAAVATPTTILAEPPLVATEAPSTEAVPPSPTEGDSSLLQESLLFPWWNDSIFYEIFVRSFYDSDGDGIGDFTGLVEKLDYLNDGDPETSNDLGITGIWLMPIHPSPSYHGYDVTDYYDVNPEYGTMEEFRTLLEEAHARGIRVIIDLVLNHTSSDHPWFQQSLDPDSPYHAWYVWEEENPGFVGPWGQRVWHRGENGMFYYGVFWGGMPDLNYENPEVVQEMKEVARFWLEDVGVDGFRVDAARYIHAEDAQQEDVQATHDFFRDLNLYVKEVDPEALLVGEIWTSSFLVAAYIREEEFDLAFDFDLASAFVQSAQSSRSSRVESQLAISIRSFPQGQFATFLTNHDQNRVMSAVVGDVATAKNAASLLLTAPGVPFLYYGEEIGMIGMKPDEEIRNPMQWSGEAGGGFTDGEPWEPLKEDYPEKNVALQMDDPDSLLSHYQRLVHSRMDHQALRWGEAFILESDSAAAYGLLRYTEDESVLVFLNLGDDPLEAYTFSLPNGPLEGVYRVLPILSDFPQEDWPILEANDRGGFDAYSPADSFPANSLLILQLLPGE